jgi:Na+/proline symporter/nitrogen-specific signal transduction histidine kinase
MLVGGNILLVGLAYIALLFAVAFYGDRRAEAGHSLVASPYVYTLSLGVYVTTWSFFGSVGRAAQSGIGVVALALGPALLAALWWSVLRKMIRISKANGITSIADFIAWRYGKSGLLAGVVTVVAVAGVVPYIALQLKAVSGSFHMLAQYPAIGLPAPPKMTAIHEDTVFYVALLLAAFSVLFGARHLDAAERHEGLVAAIAFESLVKLAAFLAVGAFVTFGMFGGLAPLFEQAAADHELARLMTLAATPGGYTGWTSMIALSMLAFFCLPRQFQVGVVENVNEQHVRKAMWLFPLYMLATCIFVLPIALGGLLTFPGGVVDADMFVLALPMSERQEALALFVFIGGLSAATGMVIVEAVALSTMICNALAMPLLLRWKRLQIASRPDVSGLVLAIRRGAILLLLVLAYGYYRAAAELSALAAIGLVSFTAVAQFAPAIVGGMWWKQGTAAGAIAGIAVGIVVWCYTMLLPSVAEVGWMPHAFIEQGPWGLALLRPRELFGLAGLDPLTHSLYWSMLANVACYVVVSLSSRQPPREQAQALLFVDAFKVSGKGAQLWRGSASLEELRALARRFLGTSRADDALASYAARRGAPVSALDPDPGLMHYVETLLAGAIGTASARVMVATAVREMPLGIEEVMSILDEASQLIAYSRQIEEKSRELESVTAELRAANERLKELDRMKDEFLSAVAHELRTPLASIRAVSELLFGDRDIAEDQRTRFVGVIIRETERLTRLINQVLDLAKVESGTAAWHMSRVDMKELIEEVGASLGPLLHERRMHLAAWLPDAVPLIIADRDRMLQVVVNLVSNAIKVCEPGRGRVAIALSVGPDMLRVEVTDNGPGVAVEDQGMIFEKFMQVDDASGAKRPGSGLGLAICRHIVQHHGGSIWVESEPGCGATFGFTVPRGGESAGERQSAAATGP